MLSFRLIEVAWRRRAKSRASSSVLARMAAERQGLAKAQFLREPAREMTGPGQVDERTLKLEENTPGHGSGMKANLPFAGSATVP